MPTPPYKRDKLLSVTFWIKSDYTRAPTSADKGESSGDSGAPIARAKPGRPSKKATPAPGRANIYLQNKDGTMVNASQLGKLSVKARSVWEALLDKKMAPVSFCKMSCEAWDFYARSVLNDPGLEFLLYCDDMQWKLREWSIQNYSSWTFNRGLRPRKADKDAKNANSNILEDPALIKMKTNDETDNSNDSVDTTDQPMILTYFHD
jgi:hypothetical protein